MYAALRAKFSSHPRLSALLLSTGSALLVEASVRDPFWGDGRAGTGTNYLGRLLMRLRHELSDDPSRPATPDVPRLSSLQSH